MNIFYVDRDPVVAASQLPDKLIVKMPLETAQLLCTAINEYGGVTPYKTSHKNHPSAVWARANRSNFLWLFAHGLALCDVYRQVYGKTHKCLEVIRDTYPLCHIIPTGEYYDPPQCMPEQYKGSDAVEAYRSYMNVEKAYYSKWKTRNKPDWWKE